MHIAKQLSSEAVSTVVQRRSGDQWGYGQRVHNCRSTDLNLHTGEGEHSGYRCYCSPWPESHWCFAPCQGRRGLFLPVAAELPEQGTFSQTLHSQVQNLARKQHFIPLCWADCQPMANLHTLPQTLLLHLPNFAEVSS